MNRRQTDAGCSVSRVQVTKDQDPKAKIRGTERLLAACDAIVAVPAVSEPIPSQLSLLAVPVKRPPFYFFAREIWWAALGKNIGHEADGKGDVFRRPVIILKRYTSNTCFVIPLTTQIKPEWTYHLPFKFDERDMAAVLCQGRTISSRRLLHKMGVLDVEIFNKINEEFTKCLK